MPPQVTDSTSELRFKQCSIGDMSYVNVCGKYVRQTVERTDKE